MQKTFKTRSTQVCAITNMWAKNLTLPVFKMVAFLSDGYLLLSFQAPGRIPGAT